MLKPVLPGLLLATPLVSIIRTVGYKLLALLCFSPTVVFFFFFFFFLVVDHLGWAIVPRPKSYKTFSMLNSDEHKILPTNTQQITDKYSCFLAQLS